MLKTGKINENVLARSVLKLIKHKNKNVIVPAAKGEDAAVINIDNDSCIVTAVETVTLETDYAAALCVNKAINNIAASGGTPVSVSVSVLIPEGYEENNLKIIIRQIDEECARENVAYTGGHTEVSKAVNNPVITVSATGTVTRDGIIRTKGARPGDSIIVTKCIALSGTSIIASNKKEELLKRFDRAFVNKAIDFHNDLSIVPEAIVARENNASAMHDVSGGGICAALWELGAASSVGMKVNIRDIPITQETVEICEEYGLNPYEMLSNGALVITTSDGEQMLSALEEANICASIVGTITEGNDRLLINGDESQYINLSRADEIYKII